jgi:hypothetical protein
MKGKRTFLKQFLLLFGIGLLGIIALAPTIASAIVQQLAQFPDHPHPPLPVLTVIGLIQPTVLLAISVIVGILVSKPLGLRSHLVERFTQNIPLLQAIKAEWKLAVGLGVLTAIILMLLDLAMRPWIPQSLILKGVTQRTVLFTLSAVLYGGITEELLMRWGLMSLFAWIGWRLVQRGKGQPRASVMWAAILGSTLLFGLGHLPITATIVPLTPLIIVRALLLNGIAGIAFGWLYWQCSLEAGMMAHTTFHIFVSLITGLGLVR